MFCSMICRLHFVVVGSAARIANFQCFSTVFTALIIFLVNLPVFPN